MKKICLLFPVAADRHLLLSALAAALLLSGCMGGQKTIQPYTGSAQSQAASGPQQAGGGSADQATYARDVLMPALSRINDRMTAYERKTQTWQELSTSMDFLTLSPDRVNQLTDCRLQADRLLSDYKQLHDQLLSDRAMDTSPGLISRTLPAVEKRDMSYLEGECNRLLLRSCSQSSFGGSAAGAVSLEAAMAAALAAGEYDSVISDYQALSPGPGEQPGVQLTYSYGVALLKSGRALEARRVFNDLLAAIREQDHGQLQFTLIQLLGDLDFGLRNYSEARNWYEEIEQVYAGSASRIVWARQQLALLDAAGMNREVVGSYASLLLSYLAYDPQRDGFTVVQQAQALQQQYPVSVVSTSVAELAVKANEDAEKWFAGLLERVDRLSDEQKNQEALLLIEQIPPDILPLDKQAVLNLKKNTLADSLSSDSAEPGSIQEEILQTTVPGQGIGSDSGQPVGSTDTGAGYVQITDLQKTWDKGMADMQAKEYDRAIEGFSTLLNTSFGTRAGLQIEEASRLAARDNRKKAAELFVRANSATDPDTRRELLLSSRALLEDILRKYPRSGLDEKVRRNLSRIDQELASIEPVFDSVPINGVNSVQDEVKGTVGGGQL